MLQYPDIDPVALQLGPLAIHWYGLTYLVAFMAGWWLAKRRARTPGSGWHPDEIGDAVFYIVLGVIVGGKVGSLLFYQTDQLFSDPLATLNPFGAGGWRGMSFHGGFVGVLVAFWLYARNTGRTFLPGLGLLRPGLPDRSRRRAHRQLHQRRAVRPGSPTCRGGMVFPHAGSEPRHPNQLYQFFFEGRGHVRAAVVVLVEAAAAHGCVGGCSCCFYGTYRFFIEFVRQPDSHLGFVAGDWLTMGQLLSLPMIFAGAAMMIVGYRRGIFDAPAADGTTAGGVEPGDGDASVDDAAVARASAKRGGTHRDVRHPRVPVPRASRAGPRIGRRADRPHGRGHPGAVRIDAALRSLGRHRADPHHQARLLEDGRQGDAVVRLRGDEHPGAARGRTCGSGPTGRSRVTGRRPASTWRRTSSSDGVLEDDAFAARWGELGPVYGRQWRRWRGSDGREHDQLASLVGTAPGEPREPAHALSRLERGRARRDGAAAVPPSLSVPRHLVGAARLPALPALGGPAARRAVQLRRRRSPCC